MIFKVKLRVLNKQLEQLVLLLTINKCVHSLERGTANSARLNKDRVSLDNYVLNVILADLGASFILFLKVQCLKDFQVARVKV